MSKLIVTIYVLATSLALVALKLGSKSGAPAQLINGRIRFNITPFAVTGVILYGVSFLIYMYLISRYDLGYIIPLTTALVYVLIFTASYFVFKEVFTPLKILGILLILSGLILLNFKK
ncbi:MAG TPA: hypothetical protein VNE40_02145 [Candidatus Dormibacteraeota bacterium]|nr:hypothetical protein [Candidatus Dormibacteraeota bacterium]